MPLVSRRIDRVVSVHTTHCTPSPRRHAFHSSKRLKTTTTRIVKLHAGSTGAILGRDAYAILRAQRRGDRIVVAATMVGSEAMPMNADAILGKPLDWHPDLRQGQLDNGLQYVLLPNKIPPERFEAHLEIHAGSVDENEHEQGVAHLVEHVTFLGSRKREALLGTGARSNAYTDFHHTVFHVHSPKVNVNTGNAMLPQVLDALVEIAFEPEFLPTRIEKERRAVLSEAQMMNTIEYRVDCQLLQYLHNENALGCRFPIGKTDQVGGEGAAAAADVVVVVGCNGGQMEYGGLFTMLCHVSCIMVTMAPSSTFSTSSHHPPPIIPIGQAMGGQCIEKLLEPLVFPSQCNLVRRG